MRSEPFWSSITQLLPTLRTYCAITTVSMDRRQLIILKAPFATLAVDTIPDAADVGKGQFTTTSKTKDGIAVALFCEKQF